MMHAAIHATFATALLDPARREPSGMLVAAGIDPARRFAVHRNNVVAGLVDALASAFPVTQALVGPDFFRAMARERVFADPPRSRIVAEYGDGFAGFIAGFAAADDVPYLADIARLENLRRRAYHAADAEPAAASEYAALAGDPQALAAARVVLHPACGWLHSEHAVLTIWNAHQASDDPGRADLAAIDTTVAEAVLVTRPQREVHVAALPDGGIQFLDALRDGLALSAAMGHACTADAGAQPERLLAMLVGHGLCTRLAFQPEH
ncbi:MAG: DNA-binding domain-containing protein [Gammaproteobacteria bacterium]|nr:DNA-binding domain-containing protein [Gammaproteobacteria bacterium]